MKRTTTILVAHSRPDTVSGAELAIADMIDKRRDGLHYLMLTPGEGVLASHYRERGYEVWASELQTRRRLYPGLHTVQSVVFARKFKNRRVDAVLCNTFAAAARVKTACRMARIPCGIYVREYITKKRLHREILQNAQMVFAVSKDVAEYLSDIVTLERLVVAYDHINPEPLMERVAAHRARNTRLLPFERRHPVVGIIGRITRYKQQDLFVRAVPLILAAIPEARFVVVGAAGSREKDFESELPAIARQLKVEDRVAFMGHRTDALEVTSELSVCCLTSDREPFPRTVLEAQLVGVPVVAANTGGCREMVEDNVTGAVFPPVGEDAAQRLAEAVIGLLRDPERAKALACRARERLLNSVAGPEPVRVFEDHLSRLSELHV
ncbi:MAG: glycosyltransferase family 4 protein [Bacteroidota bacterium]